MFGRAIALFVKIHVLVKIRQRKSLRFSATAAFAGKRLGFGLLVLLAVILLSYLGLEMARGTGFWAASGHAIRSTATYLGRLFRGDLGLSTSGSITRVPVPVAQVITETLPRTLGLLGASLGISALIGVIAGVFAATRRNERSSLFVILSTVAGMSVPSFFAALILQLIVLSIFRALGVLVLPLGGFGWDAHIILPALVIAARPIAQTTRITYVKMRDVLHQDYVRTAYSKGLGQRQVIIRHAVRNAAIPILTTLTVSLRFSLSSLPLVEYFFGWPGVGFTLLKSISQQDDNTTIALLLCLGTLFILVNLFVELAYRLIDPQLREEMSPRPARREFGKLARIPSAVWNRLRDSGVFNPISMARSASRALWRAIINDPFIRWIRRQENVLQRLKNGMRSLRDKRTVRINVSSAPTCETPSSTERGEPLPRKPRQRSRKGSHRTLLLIGGVILVLLVVVVIFGPQLTPHSPYTTHGLERVDGQYRVPPFSPSWVYPLGSDPLGRDILSLILAGAQQTLILAVLVVVARLLVGFSLGVIAGWLNGTWLDRFLLSAAELISAFPALLLTMILILAIGIRQGVRPFVIALCFIGWGEIMQFVRSEVLTLRSKPFIASAYAIAASTRRIVMSHIVPHMIPALIPLVALEMGAVLMLLGELGFIGIFIGGGAFAELSVVAPPYHYSDVPEWGALLSNVRTYVRSYPWVALYPSLAFFISALGFNLFGEGLRLLVDRGRLQLKWLFNRYSVVLIVIGIVILQSVQVNTGSMAYYLQFSKAFDGARAYEYAEALCDPALEGRALGTAGMEGTADYIATQFEALGLQAAGEDYTYYDTRSRSYAILDAVPRLIIDDRGEELAYRHDFVEYSGTTRNTGQIQGSATFILASELTQNMYGTFYSLRNLDFSDQVLVFLSERDAFAFDASSVPVRGMLIVIDEAADLSQRSTLTSGGPALSSLTSRNIEWHDYPKLWISRSVASQLLEGAGKTLASLYHEAEVLARDKIERFHTEVSVSIQVQDTTYSETPARHVIGYWPGTMGGEALGRQGLALDNRMIVVMAKYDAPPPSPDSAFYPGANDNASGVAVMLEVIRALKESGYQPYRTLLFVAYSGEGYEGGHTVFNPDGSEFLKAAQNFAWAYEIEAIIRLRALGAGDGTALALSGGGNLRLVNLFKEAAHKTGVSAHPVDELLDIGIIFQDRSFWEGGQETPDISITWEDWRSTPGLLSDTLANLSSEKMGQSGRALALGLMILGRERDY